MCHIILYGVCKILRFYSIIRNTYICLILRNCLRGIGTVRIFRYPVSVFGCILILFYIFTVFNFRIRAVRFLFFLIFLFRRKLCICT